MSESTDAIRSAPLEPRRDAANYGDEAEVAIREPQDASPGGGSRVGGASTDAQIRRKRLRLDLRRNDFVAVLWALEAVIEDAKYHGGLEIVPDEIRLQERLDKQLRRFDRGR